MRPELGETAIFAYIGAEVRCFTDSNLLSAEGTRRKHVTCFDEVYRFTSVFQCQNEF